MPKKNNRAIRSHVEWAGGIFTVPTSNLGLSTPEKPDALVWLGEYDCEGILMGTREELLAAAGESLRKTIAHPRSGEATAPVRVRVASEDLANALRTAHPTLKVVRAKTPEVDNMLARLREQAEEEAATRRTYLANEVGPDEVEAFFRAMGELFRANPWSLVPSALVHFTVTADLLEDWVIVFAGQVGEAAAMLIFESKKDVELYHAIRTQRANAKVPMEVEPAHFMVRFTPASGLTESLQSEIAQHNWPVARADAYPQLTLVSGDSFLTPPTYEDLELMEAVGLAIPRILEESAALQAAWRGGPSFTRTVTVSTLSDEFDVTLGAYTEAPK